MAPKKFSKIFRSRRKKQKRRSIERRIHIL